jgi:hypothetical protein
MQINSPFIKDVLGRKIGGKVDYYLLFGFQGKDAFFLPHSNDGTVGLDSQLDPRAQRDAKMVFGFDKNHTAILDDDSVVEKIESILRK